MWKSFGEKKQSFYDELKGEWDMHSIGDLVMCMGDFNRHVDGVQWDSWRLWCRSEELGRKNVIKVLYGEGIMCQIHGLRERKEEGEVQNGRK